MYFPLQTAASGLAFDGADRDHAPSGEFTKRLWAGGEVRFRSDEGLVLDGRAWVCKEEIGDVKVKGGGRADEKVFVDLWRRYGLGHGVEEGRGWDVEERRTLVFMRKGEEEEESTAAAPRLVKCECEKKKKTMRISFIETNLFYRPSPPYTLRLPRPHAFPPLPLLSTHLQRPLHPPRPRLREIPRRAQDDSRARAVDAGAHAARAQRPCCCCWCC